MPAVAKPIPSPAQLVIPVTLAILRISERKSHIVINDDDYRRRNSRAHSYCGCCIVATAARLAYPNLTLIVNNKNSITQYSSDRISHSRPVARYYVEGQQSQEIIQEFDQLTLHSTTPEYKHKHLERLNNLLPRDITATLVKIYPEDY